MKILSKLRKLLKLKNNNSNRSHINPNQESSQQNSTIKIDGGTYEGPLQNGQPHGIGTYTMGAHQYEGEWEKGMRHGKGILTCNDVIIYNGEWKTDKMNGEGTFLLQEGLVYKGNFVENERCGQGTLFLNGNIIYKGEWQDNLRHGQGKFTYDDGSIYEGGWEKGMRHGIGTFTLPNGKKYTATWVNGEIQGEKTYLNKDGSTYKGGWKNGMRHGIGTFTLPNGDTYEGWWEKDKPHGKGTFTCKDRSTYKGGWKNGMKHGKGTFTYKNGYTYIGSWRKGKKHGIFKKINNNNATEEIIEFRNDIYIAKPEICQKSIFNIGATATYVGNYRKLLDSLGSIELVKEKNINIGFLDLNNGKVPSLSPEKNKISLFFLDVPRHALLLQIDTRNSPTKISLINNTKVEAKYRKLFLAKYKLTDFVKDLEKKYECTVNIEHNSFLNKEDFNKDDGSCALVAMLNILHKLDLEFAPKETNLALLPPFVPGKDGSKEEKYPLNHILKILLDNNMAGITTQMSKEGDMLYNLSLFGGEEEERTEYPLGVLFSEKIKEKNRPWEAEDAIPSSRVVLLSEIQAKQYEELQSDGLKHLNLEIGEGLNLKALLKERKPISQDIITEKWRNWAIQTKAQGGELAECPSRL